MKILIFILGMGVIVGLFSIEIVKLISCLNTIEKKWDTYTDDEKVKILNALNKFRIASERSGKRFRSGSIYQSHMRRRKHPTRIRY